VGHQACGSTTAPVDCVTVCGARLCPLPPHFGPAGRGATGRLRSPLRATTYQDLFGLLAVSGLRVGEAIRLDDDHVGSSRGMTGRGPVTCCTTEPPAWR
jgi:hypothetical protein